MVSSKFYSGILLFLWGFLWLPAFTTATETPVHAKIDTTSRRIHDSLRIVGLFKQAYQIIETNNTPQAKKRFFKAFEQAIKTARKTDLLVTAGGQINKIGEQLRDEVRYPLAIRLHKKAIEIGKETQNEKLLIISNNDLGIVFRRIGSYQKAMTYHLKALRLATTIHDSLSSAMAVNSIGNVYLTIGNYDKALQYFKKSLQLEQNRNNAIGIAINLNNIARVYEARGLISKALKYYELSLELNRRINSKRGMAICNNRIAGILKKQGKYKKALFFSKKALQQAAETKDYNNLAYAYIQTGALYCALKNYQKAFEYINPGISLAKKIRAHSVLEEGYNTLFNSFFGMKKYVEAIKYLKLKQAYHDSLLNLEIKKRIARLQIKFDSEWEQNQMQLQQQKTKIAMLQLKKQKYLLYFAWSAFAILFIILAFVSYYLFNKNRQNKLLIEKTKEIEAAENELKKSNEALKKAIQEAKNSTQAKTEFLANISHEIRTPLNSVIGFSDLLFSTTTDEKQRNYLKTIKSSGESLLSLINDILDLSKIEEGNIDFKFKETDIRKIISDVANIFSLQAAEKGLRLITETEENIPPYLLFEEARLRQILLNLAGNAIKFTREGSVTIHAYAKPEKEQGMLTLIIEVTDTGPGISPEEQKMIFMPFHQGQTAQKPQGTGLGLSITQRMVSMMNGEISLESTPGKGSRFTTVFHHVQTVTESENFEKTGVNEKLKRCLFIHEPHPLKEVFFEILTANGFQVEDVGLNLSRAKNEIKNIRLVIFCCLQEEVLKNTRNIFEKENLDKHHLFLILNITSNFVIDPNKAVSIPMYNRPDKEIIWEFRKFIRQFGEDEEARYLFSRKSHFEEQTFLTQLQKIYHKEFSEAFRTRMFDKIELFEQHIRQLAATYQLQNLDAFAIELEQYLKDFEIVSIERQMHIFKKAYEITTSNK